MTLPQLPNPDEIAWRLQEAIRRDRRPQDMLYEFLSGDSMESRLIGNKIMENKAVLRILTSPAGRRWVHKWLDDTLNYLQKVAGS